MRARDKGIFAVQCDPDGAHLPFEDDAFEWAASNSSLEHLFLPENALKEIYRVLAPGGTFLWMVPNVGHWRFRFWLMMGTFPVVPNSPTDMLHLRMYTKRDGVNLLRRIGFEVRGIRGSAGTWVPRLYPGFFRMPGIRHAYEGLAPIWPSLLCRYLVLEAVKVA
jgi:SAM-dependent methyltransferase